MSSVLFDVLGPAARRRQRIGTVAGTLVLAAVLGWVFWTLWANEQITPDKWEAFAQPNIINALFEGLLDTLRAAALAIALAVVFGALLASGRLSDHAVVRWPSIIVIEFFRAVPLLLLILFIFFGFGSTLGTFYSLVIGLMLYNGAVLAEIFRAGVLAVPKGQREAGYAIGLRKSQVMRQILAPQAVASMLPAIISQCVVALKDTALGYVIGASGIVRTGERIYISPLYNNPLATGLVLAAVFIVINYALSRLAVWVESRQRREGRKVVRAEDAATPAATGVGGAGF